MKKNIGIVLLLFVTIFLAGCPPEPDTQNSGNNGNTGNNGNQGDTPPPYQFSSPQNVGSIPINYYAQRSFVTANHIYNRYNSDVRNMYFNKDGTGATITFTFPNESEATTHRLISMYTGPFCIDNNGQNMYVMSGHHLYKCNLSLLNVDNLTPLTLDLGTCSVTKVLDNGDVIFATDLNNGSIQKLTSGSSIPSIIVSELGAVPSAIELFNNEIYFTLDLNNGSVRKISASGTMTTVVDNLTHPSRLVFDKNGSFILETQVTLDGFNYGKYAIYTQSGSKIIDISDNNNLLILSAPSTELMVPLYVDSYNNLFFGHYDYNGTSSINHCNPFISGGNQNLNIYKIQLIKQP